MNKEKQWLRWIAVFPGALMTGLIATFPLHWLLIFLARTSEYDFLSLHFFTSFFINKNNVDMIEYTLYPCVIALTFIFTGYKIAPKYKFKTATILFVFYLASWLTSVVFTIIKGNIGYTTFQFTGRTALALAGAILGLYLTKKSSEIKKIDPPLLQ